MERNNRDLIKAAEELAQALRLVHHAERTDFQFTVGAAIAAREAEDILISVIGRLRRYQSWVSPVYTLLAKESRE